MDFNNDKMHVFQNKQKNDSKSNSIKKIQNKIILNDKHKVCIPIVNNGSTILIDD